MLLNYILLFLKTTHDKPTALRFECLNLIIFHTLHNTQINNCFGMISGIVCIVIFYIKINLQNYKYFIFI